MPAAALALTLPRAKLKMTGGSPASSPIQAGFPANTLNTVGDVEFGADKARSEFGPHSCERSKNGEEE